MLAHSARQKYAAVRLVFSPAPWHLSGKPFLSIGKQQSIYTIGNAPHKDGEWEHRPIEWAMTVFGGHLTLRLDAYATILPARSL